MEGARATTDINSAEAALSGGLFFFAGSAGSSHLRIEFFAHGQVGWRGTAQVPLRFLELDCQFSSLESGLRPPMSLEFEYRRFAAACLDLAKRAAALADKTRLLVIAEAWLELAERVTRKDGNAKHRNGASSEHLLVTSVLDSSESTLGPNGSAPSGRSSGTSSAA